MDTSWLYFLSFLTFISSVQSLQCYRCQSNQPGCGREVNIRLQRWYTCADTGQGGGENFCVKVITKTGSDETYIRECLEILRRNTGHREKLPTIQRHNYCEYGRNNDPYLPYDRNVLYCFCNDWNGCNAASGLHGVTLWSTLLALGVLSWLQLAS